MIDCIFMTEMEDILKVLKSKIKINRFEQLTPADCLLVYETVIHNSIDQLEIADILAQNRKYGSAITHSVLASEEMTKALILYVNGIGIRLSNVKGFKNFFYKHTPRHKFANYILFFNLFLKPLNEIFQNIKANSNIDEKEINKLLDKHSKDFEGTFDDIDWWMSADTLKNKVVCRL
jgi:AbiV family abortive infection protein